MAASTNVIPFPSNPTQDRTGTDLTPDSVGLGQQAVEQFQAPPQDTSNPTASEVPAASRNLRLTQSELYPVRQAFRSDHILAIRLLTIATGRSKRAIEALFVSDLVAA